MKGWPEAEAGARWGWVGGVVGGTLWIALFAGLFLFQGAYGKALLYAGLFLAGLAAGFLLRPWARPHTELRRLYLGVIAPVLAAAVLLVAGVHTFGGVQRTPVNVWFVFPVFFVPALTLGRRTWHEMHTPPGTGGERRPG